MCDLLAYIHVRPYVQRPDELWCCGPYALTPVKTDLDSAHQSLKGDKSISEQHGSVASESEAGAEVWCENGASDNCIANCRVRESPGWSPIKGTMDWRWYAWVAEAHGPYDNEHHSPGFRRSRKSAPRSSDLLNIAVAIACLVVKATPP